MSKQASQEFDVLMLVQQKLFGPRNFWCFFMPFFVVRAAKSPFFVFSKRVHGLGGGGMVLIPRGQDGSFDPGSCSPNMLFFCNTRT